MQLFNLNSNEKELLTERKINSLIIYDISSNKRRLQLAKLLEGYGNRVQKSCFEINLRPTEHRQLKREIKSFYSEEQQDNIIIYESINTNITRLNSLNIQADDDFIFL